jgi:hypothetical protein
MDLLAARPFVLCRTESADLKSSIQHTFYHGGKDHGKRSRFLEMGVLSAAGLVASCRNSSSVSAYDVSGTISYSGSKTGRIHISLEGGTGLGTSIPAPGPFTIRGALNSTFTIKAYMETAGSPIQHASSPVGYSGAFSRTDVPDL